MDDSEADGSKVIGEGHVIFVKVSRYESHMLALRAASQSLRLGLGCGEESQLIWYQDHCHYCFGMEGDTMIQLY